MKKLTIGELNKVAPKIDTFPEEKTMWAIKGYIPLGSITFVDGDPGCGKSNFVHWLAAAATSNLDWPDGSTIQKGDCLFIDIENSVGNDIRARIRENGGDSSGVRVVRYLPKEVADAERTLSFPRDIEIIDAICAATEIRYIIVDTLMNHLDENASANNDQQVRHCINPLGKIAEKYNLSVIILRHLNKSDKPNPLYRSAGAIGLSGVARSVLLVGRDPNDKDLRVLVHLKCNCGKEYPSRYFRIETGNSGSARLVWGDVTDLGAKEVLGLSINVNVETVIDSATEELREILKNGPLPQTEVERECKSVGISVASMRRAKTVLKIITERSKVNGKTCWVWYLPNNLFNGQKP